MNPEQLLIEKWHELSASEQQIVMDFVSMVHAKAKSGHQERNAQSKSLYQPHHEQTVLVPDEERQRVMANVRAAQADQPQRLERMKIRQQEGWKAAGEVAQMLKNDFGVKRAVLFGSLLHPECMHEGSDIDLAVWNLPENQFFNAWTAANYLLSPYDFPPIDLVPIEKAYPEIRAVIDKEGIEL
ncbi:MAG: nucleotidyltransferase domain-containing protein [Cyanobacteria bacterium J06614_10]